MTENRKYLEENYFYINNKDISTINNVKNNIKEFIEDILHKETLSWYSISISIKALLRTFFLLRQYNKAQNKKAEFWLHKQSFNNYAFYIISNDRIIEEEIKSCFLRE
jgi:hypothetical protein